MSWYDVTPVSTEDYRARARRRFHERPDRRVPGGQLFDYYASAFERVWATGRAIA